MERLIGERRERAPALIRHVVTLMIVVVGWVFFRATSLEQASVVIRAMFGAGGDVPGPIPGFAAPYHAQAALVIGALIVLLPIARKGREVQPAELKPAEGAAGLRIWPLAAQFGYFALFVISAMHLTNMRFTPLIYFKF